MAQYNTYALITEMSLSDLLLVWENGTASNKTITFSDFQDSLITSKAATIATPNTLALRGANGEIVFGSVTIDSSAGGTGILNTSSAEISGNLTVGALAVIDELAVTTNLVADALLSNSLVVANTSALHAVTATTIDASGVVTVDYLDVITTVVAQNVVSTAATINGVATIGEVDASKIVIPGGSGGLTVCSGSSPIAMTTIYPQALSVVLSGGAATENFNIPLTGRGFSVKPEWGIVVMTNPNYLGTYLVSDALSTSVNARCQVKKIDGTNITGGTFIGNALFIGLA